MFRVVKTGAPVRAVARLRAELGDGKVLVDEDSMIEYSVDMADYSGKPLAVVKITSEQDVVNAVKIANEELIPVIARGAGSSLTGAVVKDGAILLDMRGFARILKIDTVNYYAQVEPGITLDDLNKALEKEGFFLPPDPASSYICTVGGAISEGSGGMRCVRYGTMKDWVLALRVVLGNGKAVRFGEPLAKNRAGYDLVHLMVGSEGTLGIVTEAYLKIVPIGTANRRRLWVLFDRWEDAGKAIVALRSSRILPGIMEFMDRASVGAVKRALEMDIEESEATLMVDVDESQLDAAVKVFSENQSRKILVAKDEEEAEKFYQARVWAYVAVKGMATGVQVEDVVVPIDRLVEYLMLIQDVAKKSGLTIPVVGHAGDGNVHPMILYEKDDPKSREIANSVFEEICRYAISVGGSVTGEHGVGVQKVRLFREQLEAHDGIDALELMKGIKRLFDPNGILNPGKYVEAA
jgi:glycolate oxidase subunit GlcD